MPDRTKSFYSSLSNMRARNQELGMPMINSVNDTTDVGDEVSYFANSTGTSNAVLNNFINSAQSNVEAQKSEEQQYKEARNGWQRFWDTIGSGISNITEGVTNFLDDVWDFTINSSYWLTGAWLVGGAVGAANGKSFAEGIKDNTDTLKEMTTFEWESYLNNAWDQLNFGTQLMTGDIFTGKYAKRWADLGNEQYLKNLHESSFASDRGGFGDRVQDVEQGAGYILPSLVVAYFTGGSSLGVQAAIQGGIAAGSAFGSGMENALNDGADYGSALGYGATKGAISGAITAATIGIGGSALGQSASGTVGKISGSVGAKIGELTGKKSAEIFASKATESLIRAGFRATEGFAQAMADPLVKAIYDHGDAIAQAYGSNEKVMQTLQRAGNAALMAGTQSLVMSTINEGSNRIARGKDGYYADYYTRQAALQQRTLEKEMAKLDSDLKAGKVDNIEQRLAEIDKISAKVESFGQKSLEYMDNLYSAAKNQNIEKIGDTEIKSSEELKFGKNTDVVERFRNVAQRKTITDFIRSKANSQASASSTQNNNAPLGLTFNDDGTATIKTPSNPEQKLQVVKYGNEIAVVKNDNQKFNIDDFRDIPSTIILSGKSDQKFVIDTNKLGKNELMPLTELDTTDIVQDDNGNYLLPLDENKSLVFHEDNGMFVAQVSSNQEAPTQEEDITIIAPKDIDTTEIPREYILDSANLHNDKVFLWKNVQETITTIASEVKELAGFGKSKVTFSSKGLVKASDDLFRILNKKNTTAQEVSQAIMRLFGNVEISAAKTLRIKGSIAKDKYTITELFEENPAYAKEIESVVAKNLSKLLSQAKDSVKTKNDLRIEALKEIFAAVKDKLKAYGREMKNRIAPTRTLRGLKTSVPKKLNANLEITEDNISYRLGSIMVSPFMHLKSTATGYSSGVLNDGTIFSERLDELLDIYTPDKFIKGEILFPYSADLRDMIQELRNTLPEPYTVYSQNNAHQIRYPSLTSDNLKLINKIVKNITGLSKKATQDFDEIVKPSIISAKAKIQEQANNNVVKLFALNPYAFNASSSFAITNAFLGNSQLAHEVTVGMNIAWGDKKKLVGDYARKFENKIKNLDIEKEIAKVVTFKGKKIQVDYLVDAYCSLKSSSFEDINKNGLVYLKKGKVEIKVVEIGQAKEILDELEKILPDNVKKYADYIKDEYYNVEARKDFINGEKAKGMVDIPVENNFYPRDIYNENATAQSVEAMIKAPRIFGHDKERVNHNHPFQVHSATARAMQFAEDLGTEVCIRPKYQEIMRVLNYHKGNEKTVFQTLKEINPKYASYLETTLNQWMGVSPNGKTRGAKIISYLSSNYTKSLLAANIGTPLKQPISIFFSNFSLPQVLRAGVNRIFRTKAFANEYNKLVQEIGLVAYRPSGSEKINVDLSTGIGKIMSVVDKFVDLGMTFITVFDNQTIRTGLVAAMNLALDSGFSLGTDEFRTATIELFAEFLVTQIGNNPSNLSAIARGDSMLGVVGQFLSFMQGPARGALGALIDKVTTAYSVKGWTDESVANDLIKAQEEVKTTKEVYINTQEKLGEALNNYQEAKDNGANKDTLDDLKEKVDQAESKNEDAKTNYQQAQANEQQAKQNQHTWRKYKSMGGKHWALSTVTSILVGSVLVALINDFNKKVKGKKEWGEFNAADLAKDAAWYGASGWLPLANAITNAIQGYDTSYPTGAILNDLQSLISTITKAIENNFDESSIKALIREGVNSLSLLTGIPFKNLYNIVYGAVKTFNPETAFRLNNMFYYTSPSYTTSVFNDLINKQEYQYAEGYLSFAMNVYKGQNSNVEINQELIELAKNGHTVLPSNLMLATTDEEGNRRTLTKTEQDDFKSYYSLANDDVLSAIKSSKYKELDDESKAKLIKKIYDTYYDYAKSRVLNGTASTRLSKLISAAKGKLSIGRFITYNQHISTIVGTKKNTRKELVLKYINSIRGLTRNEKLMLLWLNNYTLTASNKARLGNYLRTFGSTRKEVKELLA